VCPSFPATSRKTRAIYLFALRNSSYVPVADGHAVSLVARVFKRRFQVHAFRAVFFIRLRLRSFTGTGRDVIIYAARVHDLSLRTGGRDGEYRSRFTLLKRTAILVFRLNCISKTR